MRTAPRAALRRLALVALFALAAQALLPYLHANASLERGSPASHSTADCAVCSALAHGGARAFDAPPALAAAPLSFSVASLSVAADAFVPAFEADSACARAPPASLLA